jgi:sugar phosphate isomerase/epimerase
MNRMVVPLNVFPTHQVEEKGQAFFLSFIAESGANGAEIRRELFQARDLSLEAVKNELNQYGLSAVYSAPIELWKEGGDLNIEQLKTIIGEAYRLGAGILKVSLGHYQKTKSDINLLNDIMQKDRIADTKLQILVENDQTLYGGRIDKLHDFFEIAYESNVPVKMTFDTGNWEYVKESVEQAARKLSKYVAYIHLKQVERIGNKLVPVPMSLAAWGKIKGYFPENTWKAIEFPVQSVNQLKGYIDIYRNIQRKSEGSL